MIAWLCDFSFPSSFVQINILVVCFDNYISESMRSSALLLLLQYANTQNGIQLILTWFHFVDLSNRFGAILYYRSRRSPSGAFFKSILFPEIWILITSAVVIVKTIGLIIKMYKCSIGNHSGMMSTWLVERATHHTTLPLIKQPYFHIRIIDFDGQGRFFQCHSYQMTQEITFYHHRRSENKSDQLTPVKSNVCLSFTLIRVSPPIFSLVNVQRC